MRDAIVYSGTVWETCNVCERFALALLQVGARVLYCANPASNIKRPAPAMKEIQAGIYGIWPGFWGQRLNQIPPLASLQSRMVAKQIAAAANKLELRKPFFVYAYMGKMLPVCHEMKRSGYFLVHICMDYPEPELSEHASLADHTFVIPRAGLEPLRRIIGDRVVLLPQLGPPTQKERDGGSTIEIAALQSIPHPRLTYLGVPQSRLDLKILRAVLQARPDWHFIHFGPADTLPFKNAHSLPWGSQSDLAQVVATTDVGFMPYDCADAREINAVPLKMLDYFGAGTPIAATPIIAFQEVSDVVYLGKDAGELIHAVESALSEPPDSPKRARRKEIAREHSLENIAAFLSKVLHLHD
jgi:hypothetical protein